ncbi:endonuclease VIII [Sedimentibacter sp.]|uniref:endonuclease VIII n=1 Tax=Sedimentibacter sp. TaxID=1960295 RepID=UPI0028B255C1|nr:endonuclease VIII [Sedimentibacter sp.]
MIELPEATTIAEQINKTISGKRIKTVRAAYSPHKFAWYYDNPENYGNLLLNKIIGKAESYGGFVEINAEDTIILLGDGANIRFHNTVENRPQKHQLLLEFEDLTALSVSIQMYGGIWCFKDGEFQNKYYELSKSKTSPLSNEFDEEYFNSIISFPGNEKLSAKALLAAEQRIPGLGNGSLQDILFNAGIHPKKKVKILTDDEKEKLFHSVKTTINEMVDKGGRDTEKDLFGNPGGYITILSKNTVDKPCPSCGTTIKKEAYMGGSIYYCSECQKTNE